MRIVLGILLFFVLSTALESAARAHPMLERGIVDYENADFESALATFNAAARNADLSVEELLQLFELRALVHHALSNERAMRSDLRRIAAVRPSYRLGPMAPPSVRETFDELLEDSPEVELQIEERVVDGRRTMVARVAQVPDDLVDHVTLTCLVGADDAAVSHTSQGVETEVLLPSTGAPNGCDATARTRQGGVLFRAVVGKERPSLRAQPVVFQAPQYVEASDVTTKKKPRKKWPWIVAASAVVVAVGVTAGVLLSKQSNDEQPALGGATVSW